VPFRDGSAVVEGGAGEGEVLGCLQVGSGPDEGVVSGAAIAERAAEWVGHGFGSFSLTMLTPIMMGR
jgi:hypothetical protein